MRGITLVLVSVLFGNVCFAEEWWVLPPPFQATDQQFSPTVGFDLTRKEVTLRNGGGILSAEKVLDFTLSGKWRFKASADQSTWDIQTFAVGSDGKRSGQDRSFEVFKAIVVAFQGHAGEITIHRRDESRDKKEDKNIGIAGRPFKFEPDKEYDFKIRFSGRSINISINGEIVLNGQVPQDFDADGHIMLYNRIPYGGVRESTLSDLLLKKES